VFCVFNHNSSNYNDDFWVQDILDLFERIKILSQYGCLPYIMRHENYHKSPFRGMYINLARWCNQPQMFKKKSYREFVAVSDLAVKKESSTSRYTNEFLSICPDVERYFDFKFSVPKIINDIRE
jgi:hypothetical protein